MAQSTIADVLRQRERIGVGQVAGPSSDVPVVRAEVTALSDIPRLTAGTLAIIEGEGTPPPYLVDVALRQASAHGLPGIVFAPGYQPTETARLLAERGAIVVLRSEGARASDIAVAVDRVLSGGAAETMTRAAYAIERASVAASESPSEPDRVLTAAAQALGVGLSLSDDVEALWTDTAAVFVGEVPIGRIVAAADDQATGIAVPVVASLYSRAMQHQVRERFAPNRSRADLIVELVLAETARVDAFVGPAARIGLPLQLSHVVAWLRPRHRSQPDARLPGSLAPAVELFALQLVEARPELWHIAFLQDDAIIVSTEEHGAGDHQRRMRGIAMGIQRHAQRLAGDDWSFTLGLGTPQTGAAGLRQSAAEGRVSAESAIAAGRLGGVELTDVTGLRRVLLDLYASPVSRGLLHDLLSPLDALGPERAKTAVRTLLAYLGNRNSLVAAGRELTLHPNAVGYRLRQIRDLIEVDLADPDARFAVELACRIRLLAVA